MVFGSTEYSQLSETEPYCTCGRIDTCLNLSYEGREERTSQPCTAKNWKFKAQPATRCDGFAASGTEMSPWHIERGTFCEVSLIRYSTIDVCKALAGTRDSASPQFTETPQVNMCASVGIYIYIYTHTNMHACTSAE